MPSPSKVAVERLDDIIRNQQTRTQFTQDPRRTMQDAGANPDDVPGEVWTTVTDMSFEELTTIADLGSALSATGWLHGQLAWRHVV